MSEMQSSRPTGVWEVRRKIRIPALVHAADGASLKRALEQYEGVRQAEVEPVKHRVEVRYDASVIDFMTLLSVLEEQGFPPTRSWLARLKASWYQFTDSNARENAHLPPPACCNKAPKKR